MLYCLNYTGTSLLLTTLIYVFFYLTLWKHSVCKHAEVVTLPFITKWAHTFDKEDNKENEPKQLMVK